MSDSNFGLDLKSAEAEMEFDDFEGDVVLGILNDETSPEEWIAAVDAGCVLVLAIEGNLNELAAGFAGKVKKMGGSLVHFRDFLIVSPEADAIDTDRL